MDERKEVDNVDEDLTVEKQESRVIIPIETVDVDIQDTCPFLHVVNDPTTKSYFASSQNWCHRLKAAEPIPQYYQFH